MEFCDKVKEVRKQLHLSQTAFAKELGVARVTLIRWENGEFKETMNKHIAWLIAGKIILSTRTIQRRTEAKTNTALLLLN